MLLGGEFGGLLRQFLPSPPGERAFPFPETEDTVAKLAHYIDVGQRRLRCGCTTGTCAAAAARGAAERLLSGSWPDTVAILTPARIPVTAELLRRTAGPDGASCAVEKDGGDDPDITDGLLIFVHAALTDAPGITIEGGEGVGRVTLPGLDQPVGAAAINSVPRQMITAQLLEAAAKYGYAGGFSVTVSIPGGADIARRTFNPRLGIAGGLSILGTGGIVRPMSEAALIDSVRLEIRSLRARGHADLLITPGNYGEDFCRDVLRLSLTRWALCSNYVGKAIDCAAGSGARSLLLVGHLGKLVKVAGGAMNTHSKTADGRRETLTAHTALCGGDPSLTAAIYAAPTTDRAVEILRDAALDRPVLRSIAAALDEQLKRRAGGMAIEALFFSNRYGILGQTPGAEELLRLHAADDELGVRN